MTWREVWGPEPADRQSPKGRERGVPVLVTSQGTQPQAWAPTESDRGVVEAEVARASLAGGEWRGEEEGTDINKE